jgi:hypothetical protein
MSKLMRKGTGQIYLFSPHAVAGAPSRAKTTRGSAASLSAGLSDIFSQVVAVKPSGRVSTEHQAFGLHLAQQLEDAAHTSLYIRLAKKLERGVLESALSFVSDAPARNKARLFMWRIKQISEQKKEAA